MKIPVNLQYLSSVHMSVSLRGREAAMPQKFLNCTKIRSPLQKVSREAVAERVGAHLPRDCRLTQPPTEDHTNASICQSPPAEVDEEGVGPRLHARAGG